MLNHNLLLTEYIPLISLTLTRPNTNSNKKNINFVIVSKIETNRTNITSTA